MKKLLLSLALLIGFTTVNAQSKFSKKKVEKTPKVESNQKSNNTLEDNVSGPTIDFDSKVVDYGVIAHNSDGVRKFVFTNNGSEPLIIKTAKGSCGCTVPSFPKDPISPGDKGEISVKYSTTRVGPINKTITLSTNASKAPVILSIKGEVLPPDKKPNELERKKGGAPLENNR